MGLTSHDHVSAYDLQATRLVAEYEALDPSAYRHTYETLLPTGADMMALDVGAGSGRDAAWLTTFGFDVVAAEPSAGMRRGGYATHSASRGAHAISP